MCDIFTGLDTYRPPTASSYRPLTTTCRSLSWRRPNTSGSRSELKSLHNMFMATKNFFLIPWRDFIALKVFKFRFHKVLLVYCLEMKTNSAKNLLIWNFIQVLHIIIDVLRYSILDKFYTITYYSPRNMLMWNCWYISHTQNVIIE